MATKKRYIPEQFKWSGVPRWKCPACAFDSGDKGTVELHIKHNHPDNAPDEIPVDEPAKA